MSSTPEGRVKDRIKAWLKSKDIWFYLPVSNGMGAHGIPDIIACANGAFLGIETKAPGKVANISELQRMQLEGIAASGGIAVVVDSLEMLQAVLARLDNAVRIA